MKRVAIAGGGIGGLAMAAACRKVGLEPVVFEKASTFRAVGAGISLFPNAIRALDRLGAGSEVRVAGRAGGPAGLRTPDGRWLIRIPAPDMEGRYGAPLVVLHRTDLLRTLVAAAGESNVRTGAEVVSVNSGKEEIVARFADGTEVVADILVAADGTDSSIRRQVFGGDPVRPAGYVAWRSVVHLPGVEETSETWGRGERFGVVPMGAGEVYWFAAVLARYERERKARAERIQRRSLLTGRVAQASGFGATLRDLIARATPPNAILRGLDPVCGWQPPEL